jgi:hypothetical protein
MFVRANLQARKVYEVVQMHYLDRGNAAMVTAYRQSVKARLMQPSAQQAKDERKLKCVRLCFVVCASIAGLPSEVIWFGILPG